MMIINYIKKLIGIKPHFYYPPVSRCQIVRRNILADRIWRNNPSIGYSEAFNIATSEFEKHEGELWWVGYNDSHDERIAEELLMDYREQRCPWLVI